MSMSDQRSVPAWCSVQDSHNFPDGQSQSPAHRRGDSISNLLVFLYRGVRAAVELVSVGKPLDPGILSDRQYPVLVWMKNFALLARGIRFGQNGGEETGPGHSAVTSLVLLWPVSEPPEYQCICSIRLPFPWITLALPVSARTDSLHLPFLVRVFLVQHRSPAVLPPLSRTDHIIVHH